VSLLNLPPSPTLKIDPILFHVIDSCSHFNFSSRNRFNGQLYDLTKIENWQVCCVGSLSFFTTRIRPIHDNFQRAIFAFLFVGPAPGPDPCQWLPPRLPPMRSSLERPEAPARRLELPQRGCAQFFHSAIRGVHPSARTIIVRIQSASVVEQIDSHL